jgi:CubicO group peptidase (beta-lactamase class C family)
LFPGRRFGGGALAVYLRGEPVVDVWTGYADRRGVEYWTADTGAMAWSATKGLASTVIGKADITVRDVMGHRAGLSQLNGASKAELLDHRAMESRLAAASVNRMLYGKPAYHALTYGWLLSGLARAVTGKGMRELIRAELAGPLHTDGLHLGRPPAGSPTRAAALLVPQSTFSNPVFNVVAPRIAALQYSGVFGSTYFPGMKAVVQGDIPFLDSEIPAANGVTTARSLAKLYGAIANGGRIDGAQFLSQELVAGLTGRPSLDPDRNIFLPLSFHLGYHSLPFPPGFMPGFGHAGLAGSVGWADPATGLSFGFVHNRLLTRMVLDQTTFAGLHALIRRDAAQARDRGYETVPAFGAPYDVPRPVAG